MPSSFADSILRGAEEALAFARGEADEADYRVHIPETIDVKAIRKQLGLSQQAFAARFGFSVGSVRNWEQGTRQPDGAARAYLTVIAREPEVVSAALRNHRRDSEAPNLFEDMALSD